MSKKTAKQSRLVMRIVCVRVCGCEGVCMRVCGYNLKRLAITNDTSRCEINTVTQSAELDRQTDRQRGENQQTERGVDGRLSGQTDTHTERPAVGGSETY